METFEVGLGFFEVAALLTSSEVELMETEDGEDKKTGDDNF